MTGCKPQTPIRNSNKRDIWALAQNLKNDLQQGQHVRWKCEIIQNTSNQSAIIPVSASQTRMPLPSVPTILDPSGENVTELKWPRMDSIIIPVSACQT